MSFEVGFNNCSLFSNYSLLSAYPVQRKLSKAQAYPFIGSFPVSPCKAIYSAIEIVIGVAGAFFLGLASLVATQRFKNALIYNSFTCLAHAGLGCVSLIYSAVNFSTLGFAGLIAERYAPVDIFEYPSSFESPGSVC